ncbi:MAG TPA: hypothetical protein VFK79_13025 [Xanthobacteraceae bacterium]|nr:hypothetical protein [Xanthobacteraceae bacterium]
MKKLSIGLLAAVAIALATAPADAAKKKKSGKKAKAKAEVTQVQAHPMAFTCYWTAWAGTKSPGSACGR